MDEQTNEIPQNPERRRRRKTKLQIFKESYLPVVIAAAALLLIVVFVVGSVSRSIDKKNAEKDSSNAASQSQANEAAQLQKEADALIQDADELAAEYDFDQAIAVIDSFSGDISTFPSLEAKRQELVEAKSKMVAWSDPSKITNLSFQVLIEDPTRAYADKKYAKSYKNNFITTTEFEAILQQLYDKGYMLVKLSDLVTTETDAEGNVVYTAKTLYLPEGKTPLLLTECQVNYYCYMVDSDGDKKADKGGAGFASKLVLDEDGNIVNEYIDAEGNVQTGAYDMVPILDAFIEEHPDFSFRGAKAIIAVTGYDGLFGYRTNPSAKEKLGEEAYNQEVQSATAIAEALRMDGYEIACYTYNNDAYADISATEIQADQKHWTDEVTPILGKVDILVFARNSEIGDTNSSYSGQKFNALSELGYKYYLGASSDGTPWASVESGYFRQHRVMITGSGLTGTPQIYSAYFDAATVVDPARS